MGTHFVTYGALRAIGAATAAAVAVAAVPTANASYTPYGTMHASAPATTGVILPHGSSGVHTCSGTVTSLGGDAVVVTAAHCIVGTARGWLFAPAYRGGASPFPYGLFVVQGAYVDPRWNAGRNAAYDVAVLRLAKRAVNGTYRNVRAVTGTTTLRTAPPPAGAVVDVTGWATARGDKPLSCSNRFTRRNGWGYTSCADLPGGVSGAGFRYGTDGAGHQYLAGAIGGYHFGGCGISDAYTTTFGPWVATLVARAVSGGPASTLPSYVVPDGC